MMPYREIAQRVTKAYSKTHSVDFALMEILIAAHADDEQRARTYVDQAEYLLSKAHSELAELQALIEDKGGAK